MSCSLSARSVIVSPAVLGIAAPETELPGFHFVLLQLEQRAGGFGFFESHTLTHFSASHAQTK
jgi:hypothetical protein